MYVDKEVQSIYFDDYLLDCQLNIGSNDMSDTIQKLSVLQTDNEKQILFSVFSMTCIFVDLTVAV